MKRALMALLVSATLPGVAFAHTPLFSCYDFGDNTILCEGGFSDGSSAAGVEMLVLDKAGNELIKSEINEDGEFEFKKPAGDYKVLFNAGPGHSIEVDGKDIVE
ncbi:hypothetical protein [Vibrio nereis]|uniref:Carboxypeptidase regulatory-like domain-containing protein n=1 Tax=Vibrio nereis TaxID=693 RepID=A0A0M0HU10_VIBNE|nr:hypothetical protein [Vibrio nereis]KOO05113.1 hypothetical protein AKJ17_02675 [Vibrio nereis]KOO12276.1 hypothetical protein AKJ18_24790 [Vibrio xuii]